MPKLVYHDSSGTRGTVECGSEPVLIGRAADCQIQTQDGLVSRRHAKVVYDGAYWIEDNGSANGVYVGSERVQRYRLQPGDTFKCGHLEVRFEVEDTNRTAIGMAPGHIVAMPASIPIVKPVVMPPPAPATAGPPPPANAMFMNEPVRSVPRAASSSSVPPPPIAAPPMPSVPIGVGDLSGALSGGMTNKMSAAASGMARPMPPPPPPPVAAPPPPPAPPTPPAYIPSVPNVPGQMPSVPSAPSAVSSPPPPPPMAAPPPPPMAVPPPPMAVAPPMAPPPTMAAPNSGPSAEVQALRNELDGERRRRSDVENERNEAQRRADEAQRRAEDAQRRADETQRKLDELSARAGNDDSEKLRRRVDQLESELRRKGGGGGGDAQRAAEAERDRLKTRVAELEAQARSGSDGSNARIGELEAEVKRLKDGAATSATPAVDSHLAEDLANARRRIDQLESEARRRPVGAVTDDKRVEAQRAELEGALRQLRDTERDRDGLREMVARASGPAKPSQQIIDNLTTVSDGMADMRAALRATGDELALETLEQVRNALRQACTLLGISQ